MAESVIRYKSPAANVADSASSASGASYANFMSPQGLTTTLLSGASSCVFTTGGSNVTQNSLTVPAYSKGVLVCSSVSDAVIMFVTSNRDFGVSFRNNKVWGAASYK